mgnify:CR=1 FL=1
MAEELADRELAVRRRADRREAATSTRAASSSRARAGTHPYALPWDVGYGALEAAMRPARHARRLSTSHVAQLGLTRALRAWLLAMHTRHVGLYAEAASVQAFVEAAGEMRTLQKISFGSCSLPASVAGAMGGVARLVFSRGAREEIEDKAFLTQRPECCASVVLGPNPER